LPLYDRLLREAPVSVHDDADLPEPLKGCYVETKKRKLILLDKHRIKSRAEKACILAEEIGHYYTTAGDITDQTDLVNRKQELRVHTWAFEKLVPLEAIVEAHKHGIRSRHEFAEHLQITEDFLDRAIKRYQAKYGLFKTCGEFTICFEPLGVIELSES
jgi:hypothetical protein